MLERFACRIDKELEKVKTSAQKGRLKNPAVAERRIGRLLERNSCAARLFDVKVVKNRKNAALGEIKACAEIPRWRNHSTAS